MTPLLARVGVIASIELMIAGVAFGLWSEVIAGWQAAARYSGRLSLAIFALILIAQVHPRSLPARVLGARPYHLLAWNHIIHLGFLLTYLRLADRFPPVPRLAGGMVGYAVIVLMPFVHELHLHERLRDVVWQRWIRAHAVIVSVIMAATYVTRVLDRDGHFGGDRDHHIALLVAVSVLCLWRIAIGRRRAEAPR